MPVLSVVRSAMVIRANSYNVANIIKATTIQWNDMVSFKINPALSGPKTFFSTQLAAPVGNPTFR